MLAVLRGNSTFRRLFLAHATSRVGDSFNTVVLVLVLQLTGSGKAATVAFEVLPIVVLGPFAGLVADRYPRRRVMIAGEVHVWTGA